MKWTSQTLIPLDTPATPPNIELISSGCGGIGRRARFRFLYSQGVQVQLLSAAFPPEIQRISGALVLHDYQTVQFTAPIPAGQNSDFLFEIVRHQGHNAKQNNVTLVEQAKIELGTQK